MRSGKKHIHSVSTHGRSPSLQATWTEEAAVLADSGSTPSNSLRGLGNKAFAWIRYPCYQEHMELPTKIHTSYPRRAYYSATINKLFVITASVRS